MKCAIETTSKLAAIMLAALVAMGAAPRFEARNTGANSFPPMKATLANGVTVLGGVTYWSPGDGYHPLTLDAYLPPAALGGARRPAVVYIHGGSWMAGSGRSSASLQDLPGVLSYFASQGYVAFGVNYRFSGEARFPAAIQDVKAAVRFIRANADTYGVDKERIVLWGASAGGQLVGLAGTSGGDSFGVTPQQLGPRLAAESDTVNGVVAWYGVFDMTGRLPLRGADLPLGAPPSTSTRYLGCRPEDCPDKAKSASAVAFIDSKDPQFLLIHGDADKVVNVRQSQVFDQALKDAGVKSNLIVIPGIDHSLVGPNRQATQAAVDQAMTATLAAFEEMAGRKKQLGFAQ